MSELKTIDACVARIRELEQENARLRKTANICGKATSMSFEALDIAVEALEKYACAGCLSGSGTCYGYHSCKALSKVRGSKEYEKY